MLVYYYQEALAWHTLSPQGRPVLLLYHAVSQLLCISDAVQQT